MADNLIFPIKFDLEAAVREAQGDADRLLRRLQTTINAKPLAVNLKIPGAGSGSINEINSRLKELVKQWNNLTEAQRITNKTTGEYTAEAKKILAEYTRLRGASESYAQSLKQIDSAAKKAAKQQEKLAEAAYRGSNAFKNQDGYVSRLVKRLAVYASFQYTSQFLTNIREVTAQFELQRISLGAIIQDQARANQLFEEIKTFALKSPVKILDLTKYTKQLAAYKIGVDELFDTTKRLTDISVGLGVSMDRIVLMYGQIRATGYLRASEVRQATEAGIPLVEELAKKLSKANGELVTAADVMDMISKRAISFDMVKEVFDDMTSAGGIFYNMQEKQGNTLFGLWQKLGDAAAMMYDQIGNTSIVNEGMKMAIQTLRYLMLHWKQVGIVVGGVSVYILANTIATKNNAIATAAATTANKMHIASLQQKLGALRLEQMNLKSTAIFQRLHTAATISATKAQIGAATSTNVFSKALYGLKAALLSNPLTALAVALTTIIALLMQSESELDKLNSKLQDIDRDYDASGKKSVDRFKELVKAVEENVDGSKAQKEALDELDRTYGKILGSEALELDSLKALGGQYSELIDLIEAYNAKKRGEEKETAIKSSYATILDEEKDDLMDYLNQAGMSAEKQAAFIQAINDKMLEGKDAVTATNEAFNEFADDISQLASAGNVINVLNFDKLADAWGVGFRQLGGFFGGQGMDYLYNYARALEGQNKALEDNEKQTRLAADAMGVYSTSVDGLNKSFANLDWSSMEALYNSLQDYNAKHPENMISVPINMEFDPAKAQSEYEKMLEIGNMQIHAIFSNLQNIASQEGVAIPEEFYKQAKSVVDGNKSFSFIDFDNIIKLFNSPKAKAAIRESKALYEGISPNDRMAAVFRTKLAQLASGAGVELSTMTKYFMKAGDKIEDYAKRIKEAIEDLEKKLKEMRTTNQMIAEGGHGPLQGFSEEEIKKIQMQVAVLKELFPFLQGFTKSSGGGRQSDPRLQILNEMVQLAEKLNKEYSDWEKKVGSTKALEKVNETYAETVEYAEKVAKDAGISLPHLKMPTNAKELNEYLEAVRKVMESAKGLKGGKKAAIELAVKMSNNVSAEDQKAIEEKIKALSDRISRTKTAKEFYEKILGMTGDVELAANVAIHVYGEQGKDLDKQIREQIEKLLEPSGIKIGESIFRVDGTFDPKKLREFAEAQKDALGGIESKAYQELIKLSDNADKDFAKTIEGWLKAIEKAKSASDKMLDLARTTRTEIDKMRAQKGYAQTRITELLGLGTRTDEQQQELENLQGFLDVADKLIQGFKDKQTKEQTSLAYEMFKDSPMYVQMFDDLDHASTAMLENMKTRIEGLKGAWKDLTPTQLKELQSRMNEIDAQLAKRNPFKTLAKSISDYRRLRREGDSRGNKSEEAANADLMAASKAADEARKKYDELVKKYGEGSEKSVQEVIDAKDKLDRAMANEEAAQKAVENWKKVKDIIGLSANELFQMMNWGADIARGIADISEAMGADEEDVQYWNDVADALSDISGGIQDIVSAVMNGNVVGIISSVLTAVPKMFVGFANLFSAGKIKRANKEIKRQQESLEQLEYSYGRLEKMADKLFGRDYLNNYNQRLKNLQARQEAYLKQAEAERSKGKKADKEKIKEYEEQARETADNIKELQDDLASHFTGSGKTDVARQMAKSWIDARSSMSDTFAAIKGDYADMIKNMIVEGAAARVIEHALTPVWSSMEAMLEKNDVEGAIDSLMNGMDSALNAANNGMEVLWKALEARGYDMKNLIGDTDSEYTGIAKSVAGATSEEILQLSGFVNTALYYVAPIPRIDENLARVVAIMEGRGASLPAASGVATGTVDYTDLFNTANQHLSSLPRMEQHLAEIHTMLGRALKTKGSTTGFNTFLNS